MNHRDTITDIIHEVIGNMNGNIEVAVTNEGFEITEDENSVTVKLIESFVGVDGGTEYSEITLNISVWNRIKILKISKHNLQVRMMIGEFITLFFQSYQKALDNDKADKQAIQAVKDLSDSLILEKLTGIKESNNLDETKSKFELIKNILALA